MFLVAKLLNEACTLESVTSDRVEVLAFVI
jgi:hypothetical protein